jgi:hypothetical protein
MKFGNLNFLEPSGPFQACNVTANSTVLYISSIVYAHSYTWYVAVCLSDKV